MAIATIAGGWAAIPAGRLLHAWGVCRGLGIGCFRAWLAAHEMVARRIAGKAAHGSYGAPELAKLLGITPRRARALVAKLERSRLITWDESSIAFAEPTAGVDLDAIGRGKGDLVVPRRLLRFLARGATPSVIATALAALLRCLSRRKGGFDGRGRLKSSFVSGLFHVAIRRVKQARADLIRLGWLSAEPVDQWAANRWGRAFVVNLAWREEGAEMAHPTDRTGPELAPPESDRDLPSGEICNQELASGGRTGIEAKEAGEPLPAPTLSDIRPEDMADTARTVELHAQAVARGLVKPGEDGRLRFVALAEHARAFGRSNPAGLFASLLRAGRWSYATQADEHRAARRLRQHDRPGVPHMPRHTQTPQRRQHSGHADGMTTAPSAIGSILRRFPGLSAYAGGPTQTAG